MIENFNITSIEDIKNLANDYLNFLSSLDLNDSLHFFNCINSFLLLSLLYSYLVAKYGNYLIDRFNLEVRFPKISRLIKMRSKLQKYYFVYITLIAIVFLLASLFINLKFLLNF